MESVPINPLILRLKCRDKGLTHQQLADLIHVDRRSVTNWLSGMPPKRDNFYELCRVLEVDPEYLSMSSLELIDLGRHLRNLSFFHNEIEGKNAPPDYREHQQIQADIDAAADSETAAEEVREGNITVFGAKQPPGDSESDAAVGDGEPGEGVHRDGDGGERQEPSATS